mgnify:CR=1 FL=1
MTILEEFVFYLADLSSLKQLIFSKISEQLPNSCHIRTVNDLSGCV